MHATVSSPASSRRDGTRGSDRSSPGAREGQVHPRGLREEALPALAEWLRAEVLAPHPHRHVVFTMPRLLRGIFRKRRELLLNLSQCGAEALSEYMRREAGADARPGIVDPPAPETGHTITGC